MSNGRIEASGLRAPGAVLLLSCYELGRQPQSLAWALAFLENAGFQPAAIDLAKEQLDPERVRRARCVAIAVPMHTALRLGMQAGRRIRQINPQAHLCFFGHYALLHAEALGRELDASALGGELEVALVHHVEALDAERDPGRPEAAKVLERLRFVTPVRRGLPKLEQYAHLAEGERHVVAGQVETSRGCLHHCRHCPIPPVYSGRLFVVPLETVLQDARNQVASGARHMTFGDADFLNGPSHALRVVRALHEEFPDLTFDYTAKVEHLIEHRKVVGELAKLGVLFVTSAVESLSDRVLQILDKGHSRADVFEALRICRDAGMALRPSLLPFTPWSTRQDFKQLLEFVEEQGLIDQVDPVQMTIRLLVPPGSMLLQHPDMRPDLQEYDVEALTYRWVHPDPVMDALQEELAGLVERATSENADPVDTFVRIDRLARLALHDTSEKADSLPAARLEKPARRRHERPPRLTESWFC